jgi:antitoxin (DNA-binding transcriptional repressor) of toxin-antitoxin stability system
MLTSTISDFKAHLSEKLRKVRAGAHILILDRDHPIAEVRPVESSTIIMDSRRANRAFIIPPAPTWKIDGNAMTILSEERGDR